MNRVRNFIKRNAREVLFGVLSLILIIFAFAGVTVFKNQKVETASADTTVTNPICYVNVSVMWPGDNWPTTGWSCEIHVYESSSGGTACYESTNCGFNLTKQISYNNNGTTGTTIVAAKSDGTWYSFGETMGNGLAVNLNKFELTGSYTSEFNLYVYAKATCSYGTVTMGSASSLATVKMTRTSSDDYYTIETSGAYSTNTQYFMSTATGATVAVNQITCSTPTSVSSTTYGTAGKVCTLSPSGGSGSYTYSVSDSDNFTITSGGVLKSKSTTAADTYSGVTVTIKDTSGLSKTVTIPTVTVNKATISSIGVEGTQSTATYGDDWLSTLSMTGCPDGVTAKYYYRDLKTDKETELTDTTSLPVGSYTIYAKVTDADNYKDYNGEKVQGNSWAVSVEQKDISDLATVTLSPTSYTYSGEEKKPSVTVKYNGTKLTEKTDYTVDYLNNITVGTATATVTFKGNYTGSAKETFTINAKSVTPTVTLSQYYQVYTGSALTVGVSSVKDGDTTISSSNYSVSYSNNTNIGEATVTVTLKGNYTGTGTASFWIDPKATSYKYHKGSKTTTYIYYYPENGDTTLANYTTAEITFYKNAESYYNGNTIGSVSFGSSDSYLSVRTTILTNWELYYYGSTFTNIYGAFVVVKFVHKSGQSFEFIGWIYHGEGYYDYNDPDKYFLAGVEDYNVNRIGKRLGQGGSGTTTPALTLTLGTASTSLTYGTAGTVCTISSNSLVSGSSDSDGYSLGEAYTDYFEIAEDASTGEWSVQSKADTPAGTYKIPVKVTATTNGVTNTDTQYVTVTISPKTVTNVTPTGINKLTAPTDSELTALLQDDGDGFVVWDYTGFKVVSGEVVGTGNPTATLYVKVGEEIKTIDLTESQTDETASATEKSITAKDANYNLKNVVGVTTGLKDSDGNTITSATTGLIGTDGKTEVSAKDYLNIAASGATTTNGLNYYTASEQEIDRRIIVEKINTLYNKVKDDSDGDSSGREFYDENGKCDYASDDTAAVNGKYYIATIRSLLDGYNSTYTDSSAAEGESSGAGGGKLSELEPEFKAIENAYNFVSGNGYTDKNDGSVASDSDEQTAVTTALATVNNYNNATTDEKKAAVLGSGDELKELDETISTAIAELNGLGDTEREYLQGELQALNALKKAVSKARLEEKKFPTVGKDDKPITLTPAEEAFNKLVEYEIDVIDELPEADSTIDDKINGISCGLDRKKEAVITLEGEKETNGEGNVIKSYDPDSSDTSGSKVNKNIDEAINAVLGLDDEDGTSALEDEVNAILDTAETVNEYIKELEERKEELTNDTALSDEQQTAVGEDIDNAIDEILAAGETSSDTTTNLNEGRAPYDDGTGSYKKDEIDYKGYGSITPDDNDGSKKVETAEDKLAETMAEIFEDEDKKLNAIEILVNDKKVEAAEEDEDGNEVTIKVPVYVKETGEDKIPVYVKKTGNTAGTENIKDVEGNPVYVEITDDEGNVTYEPAYKGAYEISTKNGGVPVYDENKNPVYEIMTDVDGSPVYDKNDNPIYEGEYEISTKEDGGEQAYDKDGNPVYEIMTDVNGDPEKDDEGNPVYEPEYVTDGTDEDGNPVYELKSDDVCAALDEGINKILDIPTSGDDKVTDGKTGDTTDDELTKQLENVVNSAEAKMDGIERIEAVIDNANDTTTGDGTDGNGKNLSEEQRDYITTGDSKNPGFAEQAIQAILDITYNATDENPLTTDEGSSIDNAATNVEGKATAIIALADDIAGEKSGDNSTDKIGVYEEAIKEIADLGTGDGYNVTNDTSVSENAGAIKTNAEAIADAIDELEEKRDSYDVQNDNGWLSDYAEAAIDGYIKAAIEGLKAIDLVDSKGDAIDTGTVGQEIIALTDNTTDRKISAAAELDKLRYVTDDDGNLLDKDGNIIDTTATGDEKAWPAVLRDLTEEKDGASKDYTAISDLVNAAIDELDALCPIPDGVKVVVSDDDGDGKYTYSFTDKGGNDLSAATGDDLTTAIENLEATAKKIADGIEELEEKNEEIQANDLISNDVKTERDKTVEAGIDTLIGLSLDPSAATTSQNSCDDTVNKIIDESDGYITLEEMRYVPETDENGNIIYETEKDENGDTKYDEDGNPVYVTDEDGNKIPVYETEKDENGDIVYKNKTDKDGNVITDEDGNPVRIPEYVKKSADSQGEIDKAIDAINGLTYPDNEHPTENDTEHEASVKAITDAAQAKTDGIEKLKALIEEVKASEALTGEGGDEPTEQKKALIEIIQSGINKIIGYSIPLAEADTTTGELSEADKIENILDNVPDLVNAALDLAEERKAEADKGTATDEAEGTASDNVLKAYDEAIEKIFDIPETDGFDIAADSTTGIAKTVEEIKRSVDGDEDNGVKGIVPAIRELEALKAEIVEDDKISDTTKEKRAADIDEGIAYILDMPYVDETNSGAVDGEVVTNTVDEITQKTEAIADIDKSRLNEDGTEKSERVKAEVEKAIDAIEALVPVKDEDGNTTSGANYDPTATTYDSDALESAIAAIEEDSKIKNAAIEALEQCMKDANNSKLTDEQKKTLCGDGTDTDAGIIGDAIKMVMDMNYPLTDGTDENETKISTLVKNIQDLTAAAIELADEKNDRGNSTDVQDVADSAISKVFDLATSAKDMATKSDIATSVANIKDGADLIMEAIRAEEELKDGYDDDPAITNITKGYIDKAIEDAIADLKEVDFGATVSTDDVKANIKGITDYSTDLKTAAMAEVDKSRLETEKDKNGNTVYEDKKDEDGNIVYEVKTDEDGNVVYETEKNDDGTVKTDEDGNPVYVTDENGDKVPVYVTDENGDKVPVQVPVYVTDENGDYVERSDNISKDIKKAVKAIDALTGKDSASSTPLSDEIARIKAVNTAIADAIEHEEDRLAGFKAESGIPQTALDYIETATEDAIDGLMEIGYTDTSVTAKNIADKVAALTTETTDIKTDGFAEIGKLAYDVDEDGNAVDSNGDGIIDENDERSENVLAEISTALNSVNALAGKGEELETAVGEIYDDCKLKADGIASLNKLIAAVKASGMTDDQKTALVTELEDGIKSVQAYKYPLDTAKAEISNIVKNLTAQAKAAVDCDSAKVDSSDEVNKVLEQAIDNIIAVTGDGITAAPDGTNGIETLVNGIVTNKNAIVAAIKAEEKLLADYEADDDISDNGEKVIKELIDKAIDDLQTIPFTAGTSADTVSGLISDYTTDTTYKKTAAIAGVDKTRLDSDGNERSDNVVDEINDVVAAIAALTDENTIESDISGYETACEKICAGIEKLEEKKAEIDGNDNLRTDTVSERDTMLNAGIETLKGMTSGSFGDDKIDKLDDTVDELLVESDGIVKADLMRLVTDDDGNYVDSNGDGKIDEKSAGSIAEIDNAITLINGLTYNDYNKDTHQKDIDAILDFLGTKTDGIEELTSLIDKINSSDMTDEQKKALTDLLEGGVDKIEAYTYATADETAMNNIKDNLSALAKAALDCDDEKDGASDNVKEVLSQAIDNIIAVGESTTDFTASPDSTGTGITDAVKEIKDNRDLIVAAIEAEEKALADYEADDGLSDTAKEAIEELIDAAIEDLKDIDFAAGTDSADVEDEITAITTDSTDIKTEAIAKIDALRYDENGDEKSDNVSDVVDGAIKDVVAIDTDKISGDDLQDDVDEIYDGTKTKVEAVDKIDDLLDEIASSNMTDEQKKALTDLLESGVDKIDSYDYPLSSDDETAINNIVDNLTAIAEGALDCDDEKNGASDNVKEVLSQAIDNIIAVGESTTDFTASPDSTGTGITDTVKEIKDNRDLIVAAIEAEEKALADYKADGSISDNGKSTIEELINSAIEDLKDIGFTAGTDSADVKDEITAITTDTTDIKTAAIAELDKTRLDGNGNEKSAAVIAEINEAVGKIAALDSSGDDLKDDIDSIVSSEEDLVSGIESLEDKLSSVQNSSLSAEGKAAVENAINNAIAEMGAISYDEDNPVDGGDISDINELVAYKQSAIVEIDPLKSGKSSEVASIANAAMNNIANVDLSDEGSLANAKSAVDSIKNTAKDDISEQIIRDDAVAEIEKYVSDNSISTDDERVSAKIAEVINGIKNLDRNSGESLTAFADRVAEIVADGKTDIRAEQFRHDNPVTEKSNDEVTLSDVADLEKALEEYNGLTDEEKAAVAELYQPDYSSFENLVSTKNAAAEFNTRKAEIIEEIKNKQHAHDGSLVTDEIAKQVETISSISFGEGEKSADEIEAKNSELEAAREQALTEISLVQKKQQAINQLEEERDRLIATGQYLQSGIDELNSIFEEAQKNILAVTSSDDWENLIDGYYDDAMIKYSEVRVYIITRGDVSENGGSEDDDYEADHDYGDGSDGDSDGGSNGYWGIVANEEGMTPGIELVIEKKEDKSEVKSALKAASEGSGTVTVQENSSMTEEEARESIKDKEIKATFDVYLVKQGEVIRNFNGTYTVKILLPENMRNMVGLQVVYMNDDGTLEVLDTSSEGNYLVFNTDHFSEFIIVGEKEVNLLWIAILEGVIILASAAAIFIILRKNGKKGEKASAVALPALLTVILPDGIIPVIIVLGIFAVAALIALAVVIVRSRKGDGKTAENNSDEEKQQ